MKRDIVARKPYSANPSDDYLEVVLAKVDDNNCPCVTWIYNKQSNGYSSGHYFTGLKEALVDFNTRGNLE